MAFAAVSWQYRDVFTSAKAAQMEENVRVHDHRTPGQGATLGIGKAAASGDVLIAEGVGIAANAAATTTISFPAGRFATPPNVAITIDGGLADSRSVVAYSATVDGATVRLYAGVSAIGTGGIRARWLAVEP